ncbi:hypothetical protein CLU79DRAFT_838690 [Phycomyces nitens]|nr:hypothetical protein CLU79DRAFT_838690 [Phycomyces nitens]
MLVVLLALLAQADTTATTFAEEVTALSTVGLADGIGMMILDQMAVLGLGGSSGKEGHAEHEHEYDDGLHGYVVLEKRGEKERRVFGSTGNSSFYLTISREELRKLTN